MRLRRSAQSLCALIAFGIYHDGWLANTVPRNMPWDITKMRPGSDITTYQWELYDLSTDFSQSHDLAAAEPQKLKAMQALFDTEARRNNVYPIQDSGARYRAMQTARYLKTPMRNQYVYWGKDIPLSYATMPPIFYLPRQIGPDILCRHYYTAQYCQRCRGPIPGTRGY